MVKFLVEHVTQFPSDADLKRYINTLSDKVRDSCNTESVSKYALVTLDGHNLVNCNFLS